MTWVQAVEAADELVGDDGSVVLLAAGGGHRVVRLSALGQAVRELSGTGQDLNRLTEQLVERLGAPGEGADVDEILRRELATLEAEGVVRLQP